MGRWDADPQGAVGRKINLSAARRGDDKAEPVQSLAELFSSLDAPAGQDVEGRRKKPSHAKAGTGRRGVFRRAAQGSGGGLPPELDSGDPDNEPQAGSGGLPPELDSGDPDDEPQAGSGGLPPELDSGDPDDGPQEGGKRKKRKKRKHWGLRAMALGTLAALVAVGVVGLSGLAAYLNSATANDYLWLELEQLPEKSATILYAQNTDTGEWEEYARLEATQQKIWVDLEDVPDNLKNAFIAVEDRTFYEHNGISLRRTIFAVLNEVKMALTGTYFGGEEGQKQGASTIDQQLIKNLTRDEDTGGLDGYMRKIREIWRAIKLDEAYDKDTILEAYLNVISFTGNTAGVQAESIKLFNKTVDQLSLAQCASIAAITKNPARYDPATNPDNNIERRNYILYEMWQQGYITEEEYNTASAEPLILTPGEVNLPKTETTTWFTDQVLNEVSEDMAEEFGLSGSEITNLLYNGGLHIYTTVDTKLQSIMEQAMTEGNFFVRPGKESTAVVYDENGDAVLDANGDPVREDVIELPQAAMVSLDYQGRLRAVVGSLDEKEVSRAFNRGTDAVRQVGSTMKPVGAYALALEKNRINWSTPFLDAPVGQEENPETGEMEVWPANFSRTYSGRDILVADALAESINTVAVRVGQTVGVNEIYDFVTHTLEISSFTEEDQDWGPMVLGSSTYGVSPYQLAGAYMMFGSGGTFSTLHSYESVQTSTGHVLMEPELETKQAISPDTAWVMNRLLAGVMEGKGTAAGYAVPGEMESIGKTGTSNDNRDYWFVGLTPYYVTAVWYGYDSNYSLNIYNGTSAPARAWQYVMQQAQQELPQKQFPQDDSVVEAEYCTDTGELAADGCPRTESGYYRAGQLPQICTTHTANQFG